MQTLTRDQLIHGLQADAPSAALGLLMFAVGLAALALYRLRARAKDPSLLWFGVFLSTYGIRLLLETDLVRLTLAMPPWLRDYFVSGLTYLIPIPALFFLAIVFPSWNSTLVWILRAVYCLSAIGIAADVISRQPGYFNGVNDLLVLVAVAALIITLFRRKSTVTERALRIGILVLVATVILTNLDNVRGRERAVIPFNPEPFGFAFFMGSLGLVVARRAIDNEQRLVEIEKELEIAKRIQISILPRELPRNANLHVAARYLPMTAVAGDFYEFLVVDEQHVGILVADVSGHGVPAALIASMVKVAIAAQLPHAGEPAKVLTGMNEILSGKLQGQFVTAAYLFLDLAKGQLRYSAAGHPPLLWWRTDLGHVDSLEQNGLVLGLFARAPYTVREEQFSKGDRFLLYTDGIVEATNGTEEFFGEERLSASLAGARGLDAEASVAAILEGLSVWSKRVGADQEDDLTLVCVDVRPAAGAGGG